MGYGCEPLPNLQREGVLQQVRSVALLQEQCPNGSPGPNRGLKRTFAVYRGAHVEVLLSHGSCGVVVEDRVREDASYPGAVLKEGEFVDLLDKPLITTT